MVVVDADRIVAVVTSDASVALVARLTAGREKRTVLVVSTAAEHLDAGAVYLESAPGIYVSPDGRRAARLLDDGMLQADGRRATVLSTFSVDVEALVCLVFVVEPPQASPFSLNLCASSNVPVQSALDSPAAIAAPIPGVFPGEFRLRKESFEVVNTLPETLTPPAPDARAVRAELAEKLRSPHAAPVVAEIKALIRVLSDSRTPTASRVAAVQRASAVIGGHFASGALPWNDIDAARIDAYVDFVEEYVFGKAHDAAYAPADADDALQDRFLVEECRVLLPLGPDVFCHVEDDSATKEKDETELQPKDDMASATSHCSTAEESGKLSSASSIQSGLVQKSTTVNSKEDAVFTDGVRDNNANKASDNSYTLPATHQTPIADDIARMDLGCDVKTENSETQSVLASRPFKTSGTPQLQSEDKSGDVAADHSSMNADDDTGDGKFSGQSDGDALDSPTAKLPSSPVLSIHTEDCVDCLTGNCAVHSATDLTESASTAVCMRVEQKHDATSSAKSNSDPSLGQDSITKDEDSGQSSTSPCSNVFSDAEVAQMGETLRDMESATSPLAKLRALVAFVSAVSRSGAHSADDLIPALAWAIVVCTPSHFVSDMRYIQRFRHAAGSGPRAHTGLGCFCLTSAVAAVTAIEAAFASRIGASDPMYALLAAHGGTFDGNSAIQRSASLGSNLAAHMLAASPVPPAVPPRQDQSSPVRAGINALLSAVGRVPRAISSAMDSLRSRASSPEPAHKEMGDGKEAQFAQMQTVRARVRQGVTAAELSDTELSIALEDYRALLEALRRD